MNEQTNGCGLVSRYYGRRRGEGIHTGKQAKVTVNYVDKVRFEVEPDFQRDTKFTQLWCVPLADLAAP